MAIVDMKKLSVIAMRSDEDAIIETIMGLGAFQAENFVTEDTEKLLSKNDKSQLITEYDAQLKMIKEALDILAPYVKTKKALFAPKNQVSKALFADIKAEADSEREFAKKVCTIHKRIGEIKSEQNRILSEIESLEKWKNLPFELGYKGTKNTGAIIGTIERAFSAQDIQKEIDEAGIIAQIEKVDSASDGEYVYVLYHKSSETKMMELLLQKGFSSVNIKGRKRAGAIIDEYKQKLSSLEHESERCKEKLEKMAESKLRLEVLYDYTDECRQKECAISELYGTDSTVIIEGWVVSEAAQDIKNILEKKFVCEAEYRAPTEQEAYPILLKNPKIVQPFEAVTEMYSLPAPHSMDPNKLMAPFYFLFFGMMVSDAGYGLLLAIATLFIILKYKPQGQSGKLIKLICLGGVSTMMWGIIFGGYFGDTIPVVVKMATGKAVTIPSLMNPSADPISVLILSLILGLIHLFAGMGAKAYLLIKRGHFWSAVFDIGFWYLVLGGLAVVCLGMVTGGITAKIGMWISIAGAVGLILTQGREKKNIIGKLVGGVGSLYDIVSYMSDILSYSRLLALGLSTGVVASVVNTMGSMGGNTVFGWIMFAAVFIIGHVFNIAINTLGAYVHASRLQYVEFFGKFYESGGKAFKPLTRPRKYIEVVDK